MKVTKLIALLEGCDPEIFCGITDHSEGVRLTIRTHEVELAKVALYLRKPHITVGDLYGPTD